MERHPLEELYAVIASRKNADPQESYTARLFAKGTGKIAKKLGEEGVETALAGHAGSRREVIAESADLLYHLLVLWAARDVAPAEVWKTLAERAGVSGLLEKASREED